MKPIRVLIVEDSAVVREHLRRIIAADTRFEVVGMTASGEEAVDAVERLAPDVISMDIQLPGIGGFEATRRIMTRRPTPIVIVSGTESRDVSLAMEAFKAGALSIVEKPVSSAHQAYEGIAGRLRTQLAIMSEVKVVRQREPGGMRRAGRFPAAGENPWRLLAVGASTGGPNALSQVLGGLGAGFPLPIVVVQHMAQAFLDGFAQWLSSLSGFPVTVVNERVLLAPGQVYLAPGDSHLAIDGVSALLDGSPPVKNHRPSANVLFASAARHFGSSVIGVLLTGMGDDGASGLREIKDAGGFTIAEAESSAVIYGMPGAAVKLGAACESVALEGIAARILEIVGQKKEGR